ncbi:MAG: type IV pilus secretin PilQ [Cardiobacteriaceae bacterium]|nr:type IV pilus secretin PilQ [Cardiobacteriaceae bacterium]
MATAPAAVAPNAKQVSLNGQSAQAAPVAQAPAVSTPAVAMQPVAVPQQGGKSSKAKKEDVYKIKGAQIAGANVDALMGYGYNKKYTGAPLSLNFQDIEVRAVIQIIAEFTNNNIVVSDSVRGNITLRLDNVPWDQALDIIMKTKGLSKREVNRVIYVAPAAELDSAEIAALEAWQRKQNLRPTQQVLIQVKYAKAADLAAIIRAASRDGAPGSRDESMLSSRGSVTVDNRTNTILVNDIPEYIQRVRSLVERLDEPVRQVMIDSRIVLSTDNFNNEYGGNFGLMFGGDSGHDTLVQPGRYGSGSGDVGSSSINNVTWGGRGYHTTWGGSAGSLQGTDNRLGISILGTEVNVDLELRAMQAEGRTEMLSNPKVVTQDGYKALISSGKEIPYSTYSNNGTNVEFKDAKLELEVTPRINPNDRVAMEIHINKDSASDSRLGSEPSIDTNEVQTQVEVDNGETIVLGGIYEQTQNKSISKTPILGDIPAIGNLFKQTKKEFTKSELLVFLTPRIIDKALTDYDKFSGLKK